MHLLILSMDYHSDATFDRHRLRDLELNNMLRQFSRLRAFKNFRRSEIKILYQKLENAL
jgi:hypothetical protein